MRKLSRSGVSKYTDSYAKSACAIDLEDAGAGVEPCENAERRSAGRRTCGRRG